MWIWNHLKISSNLETNRFNIKLNIQDLNFALLNEEKLENLPDKIEVNVIYRLALASNTKGELRSSHSSSKVCFVYLDAYKYDHYSWKNIRSTQYPKNNPEFIKIYYSYINSEKKKDGRCVKHVYISKMNDFDVLVHYQGKLTSLRAKFIIER